MQNTIKSIFLVLTIINIISCNTKNKKSDITVKNTTSEEIESINEKVYIESNGTKLYAEIKGKDKTKPVILFLHGGPGDVALGLLPFQVYTGKDLEENFVMVYMHQRGLVNSSAAPDSSQTIKNHISDVENVVNYLTKKMNKEKITLIGHSWGGLLGSLYLIKDDSKIEKFIAVATPFNFEKNNNESFDYTMKWAKSEQNKEAIAELNKLASPPIDTFDKLTIKSKWASQAFGGIGQNISMKKITEETDYKEIKREWQLKTMNVAKVMFNSLNDVRIENSINRINIPILFVAGKNDANVPPTTIRETFSMYENEKDFILFENSHHLIFVDEPKLFTTTITKFLFK